VGPGRESSCARGRHMSARGSDFMSAWAHGRMGAWAQRAVSAAAHLECRQPLQRAQHERHVPGPLTLMAVAGQRQVHGGHARTPLHQAMEARDRLRAPQPVVAHGQL
jgi:hypothetical protein